MIFYEADNDIFELAISLIKERLPEVRLGCEHDDDDLWCPEGQLAHYEKRVSEIFQEARRTILERGGERNVKYVCDIILDEDIKDDISFVSDEEYERKYGSYSEDDDKFYTFNAEYDGICPESS